MKLHFIFFKMLCIAYLFVCTQANAQVTIGKGLPPKSGSLLDLKENDNLNQNSTKGFLLPRVALEDVVKMGPCVQSDLAQLADKQAHVGLTVYNVTDSIEVGLCPGVYVWTSEQWVRIPDPCVSAIGPELLYSPNCYIVSPGQASEEIPIAKAYLVSESRSDLTDLNRSDKVYVKILWQDTQNLIDKVELVDGDKGIYSKFKVTAKGTTQGNALVAIHVGPNGNDSDPIVWSWHIWVTDYNPNNGGTTYTYNNSEKEYIFMDRNIGALNTTPTDPNSMGVMYQWGRKDPFTAAAGNWTHNFRDLYSHSNILLNEVNEELGNGNTQPSGTGIKHITPPSGASNLALSIQNPMAFYAGPYIKGDGQYIFDWYSGDGAGTVSDNELWGTPTQKSPFDPCPAGWRVPAYSASKSPWAPYVDTSGWGGGWGDGTDGLSTTGSNGYNFVGTSSRTALGYYPAGFARAPKAFFKGGPVGTSDQYPSAAGGTFLVIGYETANGQDRIEAHYWTSSISNNTKAKMLSITIGMMGDSSSDESLSPKAKGAFVRCVKE
ncbi:MAG: hypothetical protein ACK5KT_15225 [Dysgonomonas sp.]